MTIERNLFKLDKPCGNPRPDRRKKSWESLPEFPPGLYLHTSRMGKLQSIHEIQRVSHAGLVLYGLIKSNTNPTEYDALMLAAQKIEPDPHNLCHTLALHPDLEPRNMCKVLSELLRTKVISPEQLATAFKSVAEMLEE